jgi:L-threonylcarbamoyladenylate synthase
MKKFWFKRKKYGWGWYPATFEGWFLDFIYIVLLTFIFSSIDKYSHSVSDTLIGIVVPMTALTCIFIIITWLKGEKLRWQWGKRVEDEADVILRDGVAVIATDTTYGIVGSALSERAVNELYRLRKRDLNKPFIVLIPNKRYLRKFGVIPTAEQNKILKKVWPGPVSVILPCTKEKFAYLHRGTKTLAFRVPAKRELQILLQQTGPLVAPSANPQGLPVAKSISEARAYFGHHVDFYKDGGEFLRYPSRLIDITDGTEKILR